MYTQARLWRFCMVLMLFSWGLMLAGCGKTSVATVSGKVTYRGQPLKGGTISLIPNTGGVLSSPIEEDGSYKFSKVPLGAAKVTVDTKSVRPVEQKSLPGPYANAPKDVLPPNLQGGDPNRYVAIPEHYADPEKSGLSLEVKSGKNEQNIDLK